jgi:hypothetical protein
MNWVTVKVQWRNFVVTDMNFNVSQKQIISSSAFSQERSYLTKLFDPLVQTGDVNFTE